MNLGKGTVFFLKDCNYNSFNSSFASAQHRVVQEFSSYGSSDISPEDSLFCRPYMGVKYCLNS